MSRGLISGLVWGAIFGGLGLTVVSLLTPAPTNRAEDAAVLAPEAAQETPPEAGAVETPETPEPATTPATTPVPAAPQPVEQMPAEERTEAPAPAPDVVSDAPQAEAAPAAPAGAEVSVGPAADTSVASPLAEPGAAPAPQPEPPPAAGTTAPPATPAASAASESPAGPSGVAETASSVALPEATPDPASPAAPATPVAAAPEPAPSAPTGGISLPQIATPATEGAASGAEPEETVQASTGAESSPARIQLGSESGFGERETGVRINRLPSIGGEEPGAQVAPVTEAEPTVPARAVDRYAAAFENPDAKPLLSLVVLDLGEDAGGLDQAALSDVPFPVTFAISADRPDATARENAYRQAGFEVVMVAGDLPDNATPSDIEVAFEVFRAALPEAVAVLDAPDGGFQGKRQLSAQVVAILNADGQGLLTYDRGLNSAEQIAQREGLPTATVFRDIDAEPEDAEAIRRALDRAALRAVQQGGVIVLARSRPETMQAIFAWALEGRAESVALAPVTAQLSGR